jgi:tetratricopeptide (TPR) repeat protein
MRLLFAIVFVTATTLQIAAQSTQPAVDALLAQANQAIAKHDDATAVPLLNQALDLSPNSPQANLMLGDILLASNQFPEAMDRYETLLALTPRSAPARSGEYKAATQLALLARRNNQPEAALACLRHARQYLPDDPRLLYALGIQLFDMRFMAEASTVFTEAIALDPSDSTSVYARARTEMELQHFPQAEKDFRAYLAAKPDDASAHYGLAHLLQMQQRSDEARQEYEISLKIQPVQTESYYQLGQIAVDQHRDKDATPLLQRTLARSPDHGGALTALGIIAYRAKAYSSAEGYLRRAVQAAPDYQLGHYYLGLTLARTGDKDGSARELKVATDLAATQQGRGTPVQSGQTP